MLNQQRPIVRRVDSKIAGSCVEKNSMSDARHFMPNPNQNIPCNRLCRTGTCPFPGSSNGYCCNRCPEHHGRRHTKNCTQWSIESARSTTRRFHDERETSRFRSRSRPRRYIECMTAGCRFGVHISRRTGHVHSCCCKPCKNSRGIDHAWFCGRMLPESLPPQIQRHGWNF